jgi:hypothetical protein
MTVAKLSRTASAKAARAARAKAATAAKNAKAKAYRSRSAKAARVARARTASKAAQAARGPSSAPEAPFPSLCGSPEVIARYRPSADQLDALTELLDQALAGEDHDRWRLGDTGKLCSCISAALAADPGLWITHWGGALRIYNRPISEAELREIHRQLKCLGHQLAFHSLSYALSRGADGATPSTMGSGSSINPPPIGTAELRWASVAWRWTKKRHPNLTSYGFGKLERYEDNWAEGPCDRGLEMIVRAGRWLQGQEQKRPSPSGPGSYGLKHRAERWAGGYMYEGALIVAALALGVPMKRYSGSSSWGVYLGLTSRSLVRRDIGNDIHSITTPIDPVLPLSHDVMSDLVLLEAFRGV